MRSSNTHSRLVVITLVTLGLMLTAVTSFAQSQKKPNILVIFGDDIGQSQVSAYTMGLMGYRTPNIDRIAREGAIFSDAYGQQSCTAGRAAFILGMEPFRTGLLTIGMPGDPHGITSWMPTLADVLKAQGYTTGQFGKNHLGDHNEHLPTVHGFDEFFGNLYHLNAEEEPEGYYYPKDPAFKEKYGPRGVLHSWATNIDDQTVEPRWGKVGKQKIEDTGPLTVKRMPTVDEEFLAAAQKFIDTSAKQNKPFFVWFNSTRMHINTHLKPESLGRTGKGIEADGMVEHDGMVGQLLKQLDNLGVGDNTIVLYTTDNGAEIAAWPDGGMTPFHGEKGTTWEGGFRIPMMVRWPGLIQPGTQCNEIISLSIGSRRCLPPLVSRISRKRWRRVGPAQEQLSRCILMATTSCRISRGKRLLVREIPFSISIRVEPLTRFAGPTGN